MPDRWEIDVDDGFLTLIEHRVADANDAEDGYRRVRLGHVQDDPESLVPSYYPRNHAVWRAIETAQDDFAGAVFMDEYRAEHERTYRTSRGF